MLRPRSPISNRTAGEASAMTTAAAQCISSLVETGELSSERLVADCKSGSRGAFESLVARYEKRVYNFLWQMTGNSHDAEDLTQETFLKVYRHLHRFTSTEGFTAWLFTIAKRTAYNHFRGAKRYQELSPEQEQVDFEDPSTLLTQKDEKRSLWKIAASALKPDQYEALWLRYGEGFSIAESARILGTNQIRVRVLLHRARKTMAQRLGSMDRVGLK